LRQGDRAVLAAAHIKRAFLPMEFFERSDRYWLLRLAALTLLFSLLNYLGTVLFYRTSNLTTVKPFVGVGLAICLIYGRSWLWPVLISGTLGGILAKLLSNVGPFDVLATPTVTSATLLLTYQLLQHMIGSSIDFRAWKQLVGFIAITTCVTATLAFAFAILVYQVHGGSPVVANWLEWFIPLSLSYVIFTPVIVLLTTAENRIYRDNWRRLVMSLTMLTAVLALNLIPLGIPLLFTVPLALLVMTMLCEIEGAALGLIWTQITFTAATFWGYGPAMASGFPLGYQLYFTQFFSSVLTIVILPVAAAITERRKLRDDMAGALQREERTRQALWRAQRLEAVGRLTSGVAHDFNNLLTVILGNAEDLEKHLSGDATLRAQASMTKRAALRAAEHTKKLLAFSRQQTLNIQVADISAVVLGLDSLLRLAVGEQVKIETVPAPGTCQARVDIAQLESALLNLAVNARDAMPNGGCVAIATRNISAGEVGPEDLAPMESGEHDPLSGDYVLVTVSDTGMGMDEATMMRAFEPFFTTKDVGKGTGLGLSMVYGFIKQLGGHVRIYSEVGRGTTVKLYLPAARKAGGGKEYGEEAS
jgi:signal transduction histidine kinase